MKFPVNSLLTGNSGWRSAKRTRTRCLGLEQYEAAFRANEIDASLLATLTVEDLKDLSRR
jgi:hypothetical protein